MTTLGSVAAGGGDGSDEGWLARRLKDMQRQIDDLRNAIPNAIKSRNFDGTISPPAVGTQGWALTAAGQAIISSDLLLGGQLIGNDALSNPVTSAAAHAQASNFALTTTATQKVAATITVPAGFTQALVMASISATAVNKWTGQDFFDGYADINSGGSFGGFDAAADGGSGYAIGISHTATALLTTLGASFTVRAMLRSGGHNWAADPFNSVNVDALVLFLR